MYQTDVVFDMRAYRENRRGIPHMTQVMETGTVQLGILMAFTILRRLILAGHRGSNGTGHRKRWIIYVSLASTILCVRVIPSEMSHASTYMQKTRARHVDHHINSSSIDRFVVADGTTWRAASPTRLRVISTGAALASALQPYALILRHRLGAISRGQQSWEARVQASPGW